MTMRNRKTIIVAFLLLACMLIGVGYAALTDTLSVKGSAILTKAGAEEEVNEDIYFTNVVGTNCAANVDAQDADIIILRLTDTSTKVSVKGNTCSFVATVQNDSKVAATITPVFEDDGETVKVGDSFKEYFEFSTDHDSYNVAADGGTCEIIVTITLKKNIPDAGISIGSASDNQLYMSFIATMSES